MEFFDNLFKKAYTNKTEFPAGLTKVFKYIVDNVLPKYKDQADLQLKIQLIKKFYADITNVKNIEKVSANAIATLELIKINLLEYIGTLISKQGGDGNTQLHSTTKADNLLPTKVDTMHISHNLESIMEELSNNFIDYFDTHVNKYESIKLTENFKPARPPIVASFVDDILAQYVSGSPKPEKIKQLTYSIIEWYLSHNSLNGIVLDSYNNMMANVTSTSDVHKSFIYDINSYLTPGSANWRKAYGL